jgi:hypothetical protein
MGFLVPSDPLESRGVPIDGALGLFGQCDHDGQRAQSAAEINKVEGSKVSN